MKIAVLSGKGGTGKTTVSASLAVSIGNIRYVDCDVEEPNGAIFLEPQITETIPVMVKVPRVDEKYCTGCGDCAKACQFNAIAVVKQKVLLFPELCHHCGACSLACPNGAISEVERKIGIVEADKGRTFMHGKLNVGEPVSIPVIGKLKELIKEGSNNLNAVIDCPPGASCTVVESIDECDYCILVTEPTPYGLHDLKIACRLVEKMNIPLGVVINKASKESKIINEFCEDNNIEVLMEIPFLQDIAKAYSNGTLPVDVVPGLKDKFIEMFNKAERRVCHNETDCSY